MNHDGNKHSITRRSLLRATACAPLVSLAGSTAALASANGGRLPGLQLYTLRDSMAEDVEATLRAVAAMGYREVEFAGYFDRSPRQLAGLLGTLDLRSPSSHIDARALRDEPAPLVDAAEALGNRYLTVGWLRPEDRVTPDDYRRWGDVLNRAGELCRERGLRVAWHNHDFELLPLGGELPLDVLLSQTDPALVDFQLDFYWASKAGHDPRALLARAPRRFTMAHMKDIDADGNMADLGDGRLDFAGILASDEARYLEHLFVERDDAPRPFRTAAVSRLALSAILAATD